MENMQDVFKKHVIEIFDDELPVEKFIIYKNNAEVKRPIRVNVPQGQVEIRITNFCDSVYGENLRVDGPGRRYVRGIRLWPQEDLNADVSTEPVKTIRNRHDELDRQRYILLKDQEIVQKRIRALDSMVFHTFNKESVPSSLKSTERTHNYYASELKKLKNENLELDDKIAVIMRQMDHSPKELVAARMKKQLTIAISLDSPGGDLKLCLSYINDVFWTPRYYVYVDTKHRIPSVAVRCAAEIYNLCRKQRIKVPVTFSSGSIDWETPIEMPGRDERKRKISGDSSDSGEEDNETGSAQEKLEKSAPKVEFVAQKPLTVPRQSGHFLLGNAEIGSFEAEPRFIHQCLPSQDENVFLAALICNNSEFTLLPGMVSVFLNGSLAQEYQLPERILPKETFRIQLGTDPLVKMVYPPAKHHQISLAENEQEIVITNNRKDPIQLEVKETLPQQDRENITESIVTRQFTINPSEGKFLSIQVLHP